MQVGWTLKELPLFDQNLRFGLTLWLCCYGYSLIHMVIMWLLWLVPRCYGYGLVAMIPAGLMRSLNGLLPSCPVTQYVTQYGFYDYFLVAMVAAWLP